MRASLWMSIHGHNHKRVECTWQSPSKAGVGLQGTNANQSGRDMDKAWNLTVPAVVKLINCL